MDNIVDVATGEVKVGGKDKILVSNAIGSCIAVVAIDTENKAGGIAHVMLAGRAPDIEKIKTKYAFNAINELFGKMGLADNTGKRIKVFIVGGGNVLNIKDDNVCSDNIRSTVELLERKGVRIHGKAVGGTKRRTVSMDVGNGAIYYSEGDGPNEILWKTDQ